MNKTPEELAYQKERDEMYYRERAVEHALELNKLTKEKWSIIDLTTYANVLFSFYKGHIK